MIVNGVNFLKKNLLESTVNILREIYTFVIRNEGGSFKQPPENQRMNEKNQLKWEKKKNKT